MADRTGRPGFGRPGRGRAGIAVVPWLAGAALAACGLAGAGCGAARPPAPPGAAATAPAVSPAPRPAPPPSGPGPATAPAGSASPASPGPGPAALPLAGKVVGIDPGHNGGNFTDPGAIAGQIWNGAEWEACDTTGTMTDGGYSEARFNFDVATYLKADLRRDGARVVMTRTSNDGVGPCVNTRAEIINNARADVAVDIHADGGPAAGRGFTILEPVAVGPNDQVIAASARFGGDVRQALLAGTPMPESDYTGVDGIMPRGDLAGLNLTTVPKILVECGNMRNATDAALLVTARFQQQVAAALTAAIVRFLG
ncbi:MAG TPA: N-acetylmuramoyl-L-alanine amidase [Streptosporangiaceae bacterium]|nr:N-acetylmuramoyl-L-alanine amidase [Streptosporangiaceae bacterium]